MKKLFLFLIAVFAMAASVYAQNVTVTGVVISDSDGEPLIGASVQPVGTSIGTKTNTDGEFSISIPANVKSIKFTYVGCQEVILPVAPNMIVRLKEQNELDEVVVTGYSQRKLGNIVGQVSVVNSEKISNTPTANFVDALQGQVAGLSILSSSGDPTAVENNIRIRGINSLQSSITPLFILDGAPVSESVFNTLNPSDIESITVLKDAASTAIYGTRAANGVIVITSKSGKFGNNDAEVAIRANVGWSQMVPDKINMMGSKDYAKFRELIGQPLDASALYAINELGIDTDWRAETFDGHAPTYSFDATITGGSQNLSYYIGLSHYDQQGIIAQSGMRRDVLRANLNARVNDWFRVILQSNIGYAKFETNNESDAIYGGGGLYITNPVIFARKALPFDSPYYYTIDENGQAVYGDRAMYLHYSQIPTPKYVQNGRSVWRNRLTINANVAEEFTPVSGLKLRAQQSVDAYDSRIKNYVYPKWPLETPMGDVYNNGVAPGTLSEGYNQQSFTRYYSFTYTNTANYAKTFNKVHNLSLLAGEESIITRSEGFGVSSEGYRLHQMMFLGQGSTAPTVGNLSQSFGEYAMNSIFFSGDYNYDERYFITGSYRRDGSSRFPKKHRWGDFFSVGAMWNAKNEKFLKDVTWLNNLRVSLSYGTSGNSGIGNYAYQGLIGTTSNTYNNGTIIGISQVPTEDLTWETVHAFDFAVSGRIFNQLSIDLDFYRKETVDMLMSIPWSVTTGFTAGVGNIGTMRNTGLDVNLNWDIYSSKDWYVGFRTNLNYNHNEITKLFQGRDAYTLNNTGTRYEVGHNAGEFYMVRFAGVDPRDGRQMWYTKEGNLTKVYNEERDAIMTGKSQYAPIAGGFGLQARWKGLSVSADFAWAADKYMINNDRYFIENTNFGTDFNQMTSMLDVWTTPGQITDIPAAGEQIQFDTHLLENASFLRMKNLTVRYSLPTHWVNKCKLKDVNFHFTGRNLLTFTGYTGYDPEPESNVVTFFYPNTRQYEFGIEIKF